MRLVANLNKNPLFFIQLLIVNNTNQIKFKKLTYEQKTDLI